LDENERKKIRRTHGQERKGEADTENKNVIWIMVPTGYSGAIYMGSKKKTG
jgi:hypothetical protein